MVDVISHARIRALHKPSSVAQTAGGETDRRMATGSSQSQKETSEESDIQTPVGCKSAVWKYFGFSKKEGKINKTHAICKKCKAEIKYTGNTTNLAVHLKRKHGVDNVSLSTTPSKASTESPSLENYFSQKLSHNSKRAMNVTSAISYFICKDMRPYSVVENEGFRELLNTLEPKYVIPSLTLYVHSTKE